ncbi:MAG: hypothetical protein PHV28_11170 [Kiritimatiellae bacterium]|nr:hypothetical protein [Kiritimatiellia bacterium]
MDSTTMKGTVQGYFDRAFDEMTDKELETPLANSGLGVKAKLAPNSGTFVQFRKFGDLALATEANSDSPKMYGETEEPSASMVVPDDIFQVSTQDLAGYLSFRPKHHDHRHAADLRGAHGIPGDGGRAQLRPQPRLHLGLRRTADLSNIQQGMSNDQGNEKDAVVRSRCIQAVKL